MIGFPGCRLRCALSVPVDRLEVYLSLESIVFISIYIQRLPDRDQVPLQYRELLRSPSHVASRMSTAVPPDDSVAWKVWVTSIVSVVAATLAIIGRLIARKISGAHLWWDDYTIIVSGVCSSTKTWVGGDIVPIVS